MFLNNAYTGCDNRTYIRGGKFYCRDSFLFVYLIKTQQIESYRGNFLFFGTAIWNVFKKSNFRLLVLINNCVIITLISCHLLIYTYSRGNFKSMGEFSELYCSSVNLELTKEKSTLDKKGENPLFQMLLIKLKRVKRQIKGI